MHKKISKEELTEFSHKLENIISGQEKGDSTKALEILNVLKSLKVDPLLLRNAKIILTVNNLRKSMTNEEVIKISKNLLKSWKRQVVIENNAIKEFLIKGSNGSSKKKKRRLKYKKEYENTFKYGTNDDIRIIGRNLLSKSMLLNNDTEMDVLKIARLATEIENEIFKDFNQTNTKYRTKIRSCASNLSDSQNQTLRQRVLNGDIKVQEFAKMTTEDMASDQLKQLRERFRKEGIAQNTLPEVYGSTSGLLKCPECRQNNCTYNQLQMERADEPMTTLCLCVSCGYRWRF